MYHLRRLVIAVITIGTIIFTLWFLPQYLNPTKPSEEQREANKRWVDTSPYWLDRQSCRWLGLCGVQHIRADPAALVVDHDEHDGLDLRRPKLQLWEGLQYKRSDKPFRRDASKNSRKSHLREIPEYVLMYAPLVHLYSGEHFWPSDIADHVAHMKPYVQDAEVNLTKPLDLQSLHGYDSHNGFVYLKSMDNVESRPQWLHSHANIPSPYSEDDEINKPRIKDSQEGQQWRGDGTTWTEVDRKHPLRRIADPRSSSNPFGFQMAAGQSRRSVRDRRPVSPVPQHKPDNSGHSKAPATLILVDKGSGIVDAFWFFFYAYNLGQTVLGVRFGNHVGDWEHTMIRFESGVPRAVFFSEHEGGQAYAFGAVEKRGNATRPQRPVIYSAVGSHAMYAAPGDHPYVLPFNMLRDKTDRGPLWDPAKNFRGYWYDDAAEGDAVGLEPVKENSDAPTNWFHYEGRWGDKLYGLNDERQWRLLGQYHYVSGPQGPKFKNLGRQKVCLTWKCRILHSIEEGKKSSWHS